jgi:hypothetical protein
MQIVSSRKQDTIRLQQQKQLNKFHNKLSLAIEQVRVKLQTKQVPVFIFLLIALKCFTSKFCTTKSLKTQFTLIFLIFV